MKIFRVTDGKPEECDKIEKEIAYRLFSGVGLFETLKILNGYPVFLEDHIERMREGAKKVWNKDIDAEKIFRASVELSRNQPSPSVLRIILVENNLEFTFFLVIDEYPYARTSDLRVKITEFEKNPKSLSTGLKPISYFDNVVLRESVIREGFDEAILLSGGFIAEGTRSNIFWLIKKKAYTPPLELGILAGITRNKTIELCKELGVEVSETKITPDELLEADEAFLTSSLMGIAPIAELNFKGKTVTKNPSMSLFLKDKFSELELKYVMSSEHRRLL